MRILVLHNRYRPGAPSGENAVVDQESAALRDAGNEVHLVQRHSAEIETWSRPRRALLPAQLLWSGQSRRMLAEELARFRPDVVHVHNTFPLLTPSVLHACAEARVPVVATVHNFKLVCANGELFRDGAPCHDCLGGPPAPAIRHGCYRSSRAATATVATATSLHARSWRDLVSAFVFVSAAQRDRLAPWGFPADRCFVKYNFVTPPLPGVAGTPREAVLAFVGRLDAAKGAPQLMQAWDALLCRRPQTTLRLVIAGGGPLAEQVARWGSARPSVEVRGLVSRAEAGTILAGARAAVVPSQWEETFGLVAVEAMAASTPAIVAAHGALPELVTDGWDGALFPPRDVGALAQLFAEVEDGADLWAVRGARARQTYLDRFTTSENVERLLGIYTRAIEHPIGWPTPRRVSGPPLLALLDDRSTTRRDAATKEPR
jgi:glycosyltransferase involved in cell wall biosynthesis